MYFHIDILTFFQFQMNNPWNIQSIYQLQYFNCPSCVFKNNSKQKFIIHAYEIHPESIDYLKNIDDKSLIDISLPWNVVVSDIKTEPLDSEFLEYNEVPIGEYFSRNGF